MLLWVFVYAINFILPFWVSYKALPVANLFASEYKWNLPLLSGKCSTGSFTNLHFISSKAIYYSSPHINCLPFLAKSYIGFSYFCSSGQNILRKFTISMKLLHPLTVIGRINFWIASNLLLNGSSQTPLSSIKIMLPIYCNSFLNIDISLVKS